MPAIGGHHKTVGRTDEWLTPPDILQALGPFDIDPCATVDQARWRRPWQTANIMYSSEDDGLARGWGETTVRVWMNPPYNRYKIGEWVNRMRHHGNGIALLFARTETEWFHDYVWKHATAMLFLKHRINFWTPSGNRWNKNCDGPSVLVAYGKENVRALRDSGIEGRLVTEWSTIERR